MDSKQAKVLISISDGRIEFEGSEEFVEKQLAAFGEVIKQSMQGAPRRPAAKESPVAKGRPETKTGEQAGFAGYEDLFAQADDKIQVLKDIPGNGATEKMVNAGLLLALGSDLTGTKTIPFDAVRDLCRAHSCLDNSNFAKRIKDAKTYFVISGSGKRQSLTLSVPGRKHAEKLAAELLATTT